MTRKGLLRLLSFNSLGRHHDHHHGLPSSAAAAAAAPASPMDVSMMEEKVAASEELIVKWDPDASAYAKITSLFYEDRSEARRFLSQVSDLQRSMLAFTAGGEPAGRLSHRCLARAQTLMQAAMRRLEKEFYQILTANRDLLDPESVSVRSARSSVSDEPDFDPSELSPEEEALAAVRSIGEVEAAAAVVTADLRSIADTMAFAGYRKECVGIYATLRKSIVDEGLYRLGFERISSSHAHKMDWAVLDLKARSWLGAARVAVGTLFHGERVLLDQVFAGSDAVREAVFVDIAGDAAVHFLAFPEVVAKSKRSSEKLFRLLDMYEAVAELRPEIELVFSFESTAAVREQALAARSKLAVAARATLADFESAIMKESSRSPVPGGGVHPMTRYAMNYISLLADYPSTLAEIFADFPLQTPSFIPVSFFGESQAPAAQLPASSRTSSPATTSSASGEERRRPAVATLFAWLVLALLCKLERKAEAYGGDVGLSYLFMANNLHYVLNKVRSSGLLGVLGEEWAERQAATARQHVARYVRMAWGLAAAAVPAPDVSAEEATERVRAFTAALEEACSAQAASVVGAEDGMRKEVREAVVGMVVPAYRGFYARWRTALEGLDEAEGAVVPSPDDVRERLEEVFLGLEGSGSNHREASTRTV